MGGEGDVAVTNIFNFFLTGDEGLSARKGWCIILTGSRCAWYGWRSTLRRFFSFRVRRLRMNMVFVSVVYKY